MGRTWRRGGEVKYGEVMGLEREQGYIDGVLVDRD
jgi:hypothetical protein